MRQMEKVLIIAEAGVNHNGNISMAKEMVDVAKECGADIIKFQTSTRNGVASKYAPMAEYQKKNTGKNENQETFLSKLWMPYESFVELKQYCDKVGIEFLSTPFDVPSVSFLKNMVSYIKIPSGEVTNYPYLVEIGKTGLPVIMSTGMCNMEEIKAAINVLREHGACDITLLHCNTQYPTPFADVNLKAMNTLKECFGVKVGYSDHTLGIEVPIAAVAMGASVIEKHFTLDRGLQGPDHKASLEPKELKAMVASIRNIELALGDGVKKVSDSEKPNMVVARKSIVALRDIKKGEKLTVENITTKRPGNGISPMLWNDVLGREAIRDFSEDELIEI